MDDEDEYYSLTKKVFGIWAPFYDIFVLPISRLRDKVADFTNAEKGSKILDVATGTGKQAFAFGKKGYDVTGIDLSEEMLKVASKKNFLKGNFCARKTAKQFLGPISQSEIRAQSESILSDSGKKNKYKNVKFEVADATNMPFENNSFDVSCVSFALHDMPLTIREKVLKEMVRVTKPNGTIVIVDYALPNNRIGRFLVYHFVRLWERYYYPEFIKSDIGTLLRNLGIEIKGEIPVLFGAGRIIKGVKEDHGIST